VAGKVKWTEKASADLAGIHTYISRDSRVAAETIVEKISRAADAAADYPLSGRVVPEFGRPAIREMLIGSYRVVYLI